MKFLLRIAAILLGLAAGTCVGMVACSDCPDVEEPAAQYRLSSASSDAPKRLDSTGFVAWSPMSGTLEVRDGEIVITYETRDGSRWQVTYDGPVED